MTTNEPPPEPTDPPTPTTDLPSYGSVQPPVPPAGSVPPPPAGGPPPAPNPYAGPPAPAGPVQNKKALWSMILGIASVILLCCTFGGLIGIVSITLGIIGRGEIAKSNGTQSGEGMAITGIVTGAIGIVVFIVIVTLVATGAIDTNFTVDS